MVQWPDKGVTTAHIGFVYIREPESMDESNFGYRWWVSRQLNCQMCGVRVWVEIWWEFPKISLRDRIEQKLVFFQGILCKHVTWRLLKPWCNTTHENVQIGKNSIFPWFLPFLVRNAVSTWAPLQGTLRVPLHDTWLQVVNEDVSWKYDTAQTFCRLLWRYLMRIRRWVCLLGVTWPDTWHMVSKPLSCFHLLFTREENIVFSR
jgi:hypothetical protein